ncbi:hypothetical protein ACHQM5_023895 [Ranunculus cassubicifolius]
MLEKIVPEVMQINPRRSRFPYCIVWTPLPVLSWFIPFIGHIGICREDGVILDFAGPNFVCVDNFAFGSAARYIQIDKEKCCTLSCCLEAQERNEDSLMTWDDALRKSTQEYQHRAYNLLNCNCHSFVANSLNRLGYGGPGGWNVVNLAILFFLKGKWVNKTAIVKTFLPFVVVCGLGLYFGGWGFFVSWALFTVALVGWFVLGTYWFKGMIQL